MPKINIVLAAASDIVPDSTRRAARQIERDEQDRIFDHMAKRGVNTAVDEYLDVLEAKVKAERKRRRKAERMLAEATAANK